MAIVEDNGHLGRDLDSNSRMSKTEKKNEKKICPIFQHNWRVEVNVNRGNSSQEASQDGYSDKIRNGKGN